MIAINSVWVLLLSIVSKLDIFKKPPGVIARALGYGYDIEEDDE